ncbi:hypothetical protein KOI35_33925 [Actinoplanes bogorensis]|uniref:PknH-like extracellular domain-containing protein n=1 Tax=Paractinoplanes bogorensis TaxID=1610840 RepID=A0ABS5Z0L9_9ACTN|nr:hypothetical protein [Actinoplanes bogorensis]MBU2668523.1 hypothetical protein [Actinoplanes bogorensis]
MSNNEVDRAFAALSSDVERGLLLSGPELRRQAGKRHNRGVALTASTAAVLAVGAIGAGWALAGDRGGDQTVSLPPPPSSSSAPAPSSVPPTTTAPPSSAPATTPPSSAPTTDAPSIPKSIPARALLTKAESRTGELTPQDEPRGVPEFCGKAKFPSASQKGVSASVMLIYRGASAPEGSIPDDVVYNTVTVFRDEGATDYLSELRRAVQLCPTGKMGDLDAQFDSLGSLGLGDESVLIERSYAATDGQGEPMNNGSRTATYLAAVRVGDSVTLLDSRGYENLSSNRADVEKLAKVAAAHLADWRS